MFSFANFLYKLEKLVWLHKLFLWGLVLSVIVVFIFSFPFYIAQDLNYLIGFYEPWNVVKYGSIAVFIFLILHLLYIIASGKWREYIYGRKLRTGMKYVYWLFIVVVLLLCVTGIIIGYKFFTTEVLTLIPWGIGTWLADLMAWAMRYRLVENAVLFRSFTFYLLMANCVLYLYFMCLPTYSANDTYSELKSIVGERVKVGTSEEEAE